MNDDLSNGPTPLDEQLVAYLDGELDAESGRRIDELLATDAEVRRRLQEMERTWDLLDDLDTVPVGSRFSQTTLEMVAVAARDDVEQRLAEAPRRRRRRWIAIGGGVLAALVAGFLAVVVLFDPNRQLLEDLPVLENLDQLRPVDTIEFLKMLRDAGLFSNEAGETPGPATPRPDESLAQRRHRIESMSLDEKERLLQLRERFDALDQDQQQQLRRLYTSLQAGPDAPQLRQVMRRYGEWLKTLSSYARTELAGLKPADRVKSVQEQLQKDRGKWLGGKDTEVLWTWAKDCAARHEAQFLELLPPQRREELAKRSPPEQHQLVFWLMLHRWQTTGPGKPSALTDDDLKRLREQLSPEMRTELESKPIGKQWQQVAGWLRHAARQQFSRGSLGKANDETLANFFEHELAPEQQNRLLSMSGEEMQRELQRLYVERNLARAGPRDGPGRRSEGRRHDRWPGGQFPPPPKRPDGGPPPAGSR